MNKAIVEANRSDCANSLKDVGRSGFTLVELLVSFSGILCFYFEKFFGVSRAALFKQHF